MSATTTPVDLDAPIRFLRTAYGQGDWLAVFLKSYETGATVQRVGPVALIARPRFQAWLRSQNARRYNVYVSVNAITPGRRNRTRDAIGAVRHVFLEADEDAAHVVEAVDHRRDLPPLSYVLHSSPHRAHLFWRVVGFTPDVVELLQKHLARQLRTDSAATPCTQTTRMPGFLNHKYRPGHLVTIEYRAVDRACTPSDFPKAICTIGVATTKAAVQARPRRADVLRRAHRHVAALPPAIAGQHGDLLTFRVCCRLVRGFSLSDGDALDVLADWNARCSPPWSRRELTEKIQHARRYGLEPLGGLLEAP
jgi:hypothetical protein